MTEKPQRRVSPYELMRTAQRMRKQAGEWVQIPTTNKDVSNVVTDQRAGRMPAFLPVEAYEVKSVKGVVWGRYLPSDQREVEGS